MSNEGAAKAGFFVSNVPMSFGGALVVGDGNNCAALGDIVGIVNGLEGQGVNPACAGAAAPSAQVYRAIGVCLNVTIGGFAGLCI